MKSFWVGFWVCDLTKFEYHGPWWVTGSRGEDDVPETAVCAAVRAESGEEAQEVIERAFDKGHAPTAFRFHGERDENWDPLKLGERFAPKPWMKWPWPSQPSSNTQTEK